MKYSLFSIACLIAGTAFAEPAVTSSLSTGSFEDRLTSIERILKSRNSSIINIQKQLDELQSEVQDIRGQIEVHDHQISQMVDRQRDLYQELDKRFASIKQQTESITEGVDNLPQVNPPIVDNNPSETLSDAQWYDKAVNLIIRDKKYDLAIPEFKAFLEQYPNSTFSANAHYWLGQLLFNQSVLDESQHHFEQVVNLYPDSSKRADALLKLGMVAQKLGNNAKAIQLYEQVIVEYPNSSSSKLVAPRLKALKNN